MKSTLLCLVATVAVLLSVCSADISPPAYGTRNTPLLKSYNGFKYDVTRGSDGVYRFEYHVGDSSRTESRDASGLVQGEYAFVDPKGAEFEFKYEADAAGYRVDSDALPVAPEETDEVKRAREHFFEEYQKALERAGDDDDDDDDDNSSYDDSNDDDSSEESSEEYDSLSVFTYGGIGQYSDESSEESSEEDDDDDDDSDEEEEEEEEERGAGRFRSAPASSHFGSRLRFPLTG